MIDYAGIAMVITALGSVAGTLFTSLITLRRLDDVRNEVVTGNASTLGSIAQQGFGERSQLVPKADRTTEEQDSVDMLPDEVFARGEAEKTKHEEEDIR